jgi:L-alanine-DL-glutamate epimerase-like enolase superfamily enzyme
VHVGVARGNVAWQETVRFLLRVRYPELVDAIPAVENGRITPPQTPGIGAKWHDELFERNETLHVSQ